MRGRRYAGLTIAVLSVVLAGVFWLLVPVNIHVLGTTGPCSGLGAAGALTIQAPSSDDSLESDSNDAEVALCHAGGVARTEGCAALVVVGLTAGLLLALAPGRRAEAIGDIEPLRALHGPTGPGRSCPSCGVAWPCATANLLGAEGRPV